MCDKHYNKHTCNCEDILAPEYFTEKRDDISIKKYYKEELSRMSQKEAIQFHIDTQEFNNVDKKDLLLYVKIWKYRAMSMAKNAQEAMRTAEEFKKRYIMTDYMVHLLKRKDEMKYNDTTKNE